MAKILNIGCGKTRIPHSVGVDCVKIPGFVDVVHDLNQLPYPFTASTIDEIHLYHVLEHLHDSLRVMEELQRILKPGGKVFIRVPHFSSMGAFTDFTHVRPYGYLSFDIFAADHPQHYYTTAVFVITSKTIKYFGLYPNDGLYATYIHPNECHWLARPIVRGINFLIGCSPLLFERIWCYWVGGAGELVVTLQKPLQPKRTI